MPFERPSIQQLTARIRGDIEGAVTGANAWLRRNLFSVTGKMVAGVAHGLYDAIDWQSRNLLPTTTDPDFLARWARIYSVPRLDASAAKGTAEVTGNAGAILPAGATATGPNGVVYTVDADATIDGAGTAIVSLTAAAPGASGNLDDFAPLALQQPVDGIATKLTVVSMGGGADQESISLWRERILDRTAQPPHGGSKADYERWAREAHPAITNVWVKPHAGGIGTVTVRVMTHGATADGIPDPSVVQAVFDHISAVHPIKTAELFVFAPDPAPIDFEIMLLPNTAAVRAAVESQLIDILRREGAPGVAPPISKITEAISLADGEDDHLLLAPNIRATLLANEVPVMGEITWSAL